ncbi:MAG: hypothetical protein F6K54_29605 [Okeania sp. SIO3B5]|uniref:hypothetical protein n=1 Tax=Okeania sp. SIO3B5 TaxID=2607811 RepID=UPI0013FEFEFE|nr:hypothetical protein [Okeania sp. SIO3B5]NEO56866.1 hypothetical protein [Okeania sp. SIO3B5]
MKKFALITTLLITSSLITYPTEVLSQNAPTYVPGYWQPEAQAADSKKPIILKILNQTGKALNYNLIPEVERILPAGRSKNIRVDLQSIPDGYGTVNIYNDSLLTYEYSAEGNIVTVRVKPGSEATDHKSVYISPTGRVYSF